MPSDAVRDDGENTMLTQTLTTEMEEARNLTSAKMNIAFPDTAKPSSMVETSRAVPATHLFEHIDRTTLAERFPFLTCFAISFALLASALFTEVECLKGSGYFWR